MGIPRTVAKRISSRLYRDGFVHCDIDKVCDVADGDSLDDEPALESAIISELEEHGFR